MNLKIKMLLELMIIIKFITLSLCDNLDNFIQKFYEFYEFSAIFRLSFNISSI